MKRISLIPFYPQCIALFALLSVYASNADQAAIAELLIPAVLVLLGTFLLLGIATLAMRDLHRASIVVAVAAFLFLTYGFWVEVLWSIRPNQHLRTFYHRAILVVQALLLAWVVYLVIRKVKAPQTLTPKLNRFGLILLACPILVVATRWVAGGPGSSKAAAATNQQPQLLSSLDPKAPRPDIYFIILDAHGRQDILREQYDYDDAPFVQHLRDKGFYIADQSTSNYMWTEISVPSAMNMRYLNDLAGKNEHEKQRAAINLLRNSAIAAELRTLDYRTVSFEALEPWLCLDNYDTYYNISNHVGFTPLQQLILDNSALSQFGGNSIKGLLSLDQFHLKREMMLYKLAKLPQVAVQPGPKFVFLHMMEPHTPFVFAADGSDPVKRGYGSIFDGLNEDVTNDQYHAWYRAQTKFTDNQVAVMIDRVLAASRTPPVIVLIGDHGPRSGMVPEPDASGLHECMSNLTAVYLPGKHNQGLYPQITPVNLFRVVLNDYFDAKLPMLADKSYYSYPGMFELRDVTEVVASRENAAASDRTPHP